MPVDAYLPLTPDYQYEYDEEEPATVSTAPDRVTRKVRYKGTGVQSWTLKFTDRSVDDWTVMRDFRRDRRLDAPFYFEDLVLGILRSVVFDSDIKAVPRSIDSVDMSCVVRATAGVTSGDGSDTL